MNSSIKSNLSWLFFIYVFGMILLHGSIERNLKTKKFYLKELQHAFEGIRKNPQKYVEFHLNAENSVDPNASGMYELLPYYRKLTPLGEKMNYAIQWSDFDKQWQLIKINPLGSLPRFDIEETIISTLSNGDKFSTITNTSIKSYTTYDQIKSNLKTLGKKNNEFKAETKTVKEEMLLLRDANKKLEFDVQKMREENEFLKIELEKSKSKNEFFEDLEGKYNEQQKQMEFQIKKIDFLTQNCRDLENCMHNLKELQKSLEITEINLQKQKKLNREKDMEIKQMKEKENDIKKREDDIVRSFKMLEEKEAYTLSQWLKFSKKPHSRELVLELTNRIKILSQGLQTVEEQKNIMKCQNIKLVQKIQGLKEKIKDFEEKVQEIQQLKTKIFDLQFTRDEKLEKCEMKIWNVHEILDERNLFLESFKID